MWSKEEIQETLDEMKAECESQTERKHTPEFFANDCQVIRQSTNKPVMTAKTYEDALYLVREFNRFGEVEDQREKLLNALRAIGNEVHLIFQNKGGNANWADLRILGKITRDAIANANKQPEQG